MRWSKVIPSMYQRRLLLVMLVMGAVGTLPLWRAGTLTLARGAELRDDAEKRLRTETWLETVRGRILDRKGRVLALDRPSFDIAVDYPVITGAWVEQTARERARRLAGYRWSQMSREQRDAATKEQSPLLEAHLERMWQAFCVTAGISRDELERRKSEIKEQVEYLQVTVAERARKREEERARVEGRAVDENAESKITIQEEVGAHVILRDVPDTVGFAFERLKGEAAGGDEGDSAKPLAVMPGLRVRDSRRRDYPFDEVDVGVDMSSFPSPLRSERVETVRVRGPGTHVIGWMRNKLQKEDVDRRPRIRPDGTIDPGHYRPGDIVGQGGVEFAREDDLRGLRGVQIKHLDTGAVDVVPSTPGKDIALTLDAMLEARIAALFEPRLGLTVIQPWQKTKREGVMITNPLDLPMGTALNGAVVVIDVETGEVLAMVSAPSFTHEQMMRDPKSIATDSYNMAYLNRAMDKPYPPGSIVKPLVLCGAAAAGKYGMDERVQCTGHFFPDKPTLYRCWIYKQFNSTHSAQLSHDLNGADAIQCSCNIFFFEMGRRLGVDGIRDVFTGYGVGNAAVPFNVYGMPSLGLIEDDSARKAEAGRRVFVNEQRGTLVTAEKGTIQEAILMGIGQGPITWTPLHAASAYADIARGGVRIYPRIYANAAEMRTDMRIPSRAITQALQGLHGSANEEHGTTYTMTFDTGKERIFNVPGVDVWAKSGTADTNPFKADLDQSGGKEEFDGDHAWCVALAGVGGKPKYAVAVVVDYGGSGGKVAGPVANQVIWALVGEGYLPAIKHPREADETTSSAEE